MMYERKWKKLLVTLAVIYWALVCMVYVVARPQFRETITSSPVPTPSAGTGEFVDDMEVCQRAVIPADRLDSVSLYVGTYGRDNTGRINISILDESGTEIATASRSCGEFGNEQYTDLLLPEPVYGRKGEAVELVITSRFCEAGNAVTLYSGSSMTTGRFDIVREIDEQDLMHINGNVSTGMLCARLNGASSINFYKIYWLITVGAFLLAAVLCLVWWRQAKQARNNPLVMVCTFFIRYGFLLKQLVVRDFKTKYKRSVLGMAWSFLNPLLTMSVQYIVFSSLFKSNIKNFPVYLLSGIVFFNFFNEAVSMGMTSITGNASLIKKVYVPKYIYPVSRVISSLINFALAVLPLFLVMLLTRTVFMPSLFLLLFVVICVVVFIFGMSFLLTTSMTFFQDTQFLWSVVSMLWMYMTPIFYPESIIPKEMLTFYHMNPMYQYITFARVCILEGRSPEPMAYLWCIVSSVMVFMVGTLVFKKNQDKFVLNL